MDVNSLNYSANNAGAANYQENSSKVSRNTQTEQNTTQEQTPKRAGQPSESELTKRINERENERNTYEMLEKSISDANKKIMPTQSQLSYSVHKVTKDIIIKIIDSETKEIIREFPPEKRLDAVAKMWELAGILVDEKR